MAAFGPVDAGATRRKVRVRAAIDQRHKNCGARRFADEPRDQGDGRCRFRLRTIR